MVSYRRWKMRLILYSRNNSDITLHGSDVTQQFILQVTRFTGSRLGMDRVTKISEKGLVCVILCILFIDLRLGLRALR